MNSQRDTQIDSDSSSRRKSGGALATTPLMVAAMLGAGHAPADVKAPEPQQPSWTAVPQPNPDDVDADRTPSWAPVHGSAEPQAGPARDPFSSADSDDEDTTAMAGGSSEYTVKSGDTVWAIARKKHVPVNQILKANGMTRHTLIFPGQKIKLSGSASKSGGASASEYRVESGDTLLGIAIQFDTSVSKLQKANGLGSSTAIRAGQKLKLGGHEPTGSSSGSDSNGGSSSTPSTHTVKSGETLWGLARKFDTSVGKLQKANGLGSSTTIRAGQKLKLDGPEQLPHVAKTFSGRSYPDDTHHAARVNKSNLQNASLPSKSSMQRKVAETARKYGVDPSLAQAVAYQESGFSMSQVSPANAVGTMQVIPASGRWASQLAGRKLDLLDPNDNVTAGVVILRYLTRHTGKESTAIAGYYQGYGSVQKNGMYADTRRYVNNVQTLKARF